MKFIIIVGKKGVGKDTFAQMLEKKLAAVGVLTRLRALATPIKQTLTGMMRCDPKIFNDPMLKETACDELYGRTPREVMQQFGTEFAQGMFGPNIWVDMLLADCERDTETDVTIVTDVRFKHELDRFVDLGAEVIYIHKDVTCFDEGVKSFGLKWLRRIHKRSKHVSEAGLDQFRRAGVDALVLNNWTLHNLDEQADQWVNQRISMYKQPKPRRRRTDRPLSGQGIRNPHNIPK